MKKRIIGDLIEELIKRGRCYVDYPDKRGSPTCWGITHAVTRRQYYSGFIARAA